MGERGPKPTPTAVLKLHGSWRGNLDKNEPKPETEVPSCPKHLTKEAKAEWARIAPQLLELGLLAKIDRAALSAYCQSWGRWVKAEDEIATGGEVIKAPSGYPVQNPWLSISNRALKQCEAFIKEFGLSPSARTRVNVEKPDKTENPFKEMLG